MNVCACGLNLYSMLVPSSGVFFIVSVVSVVQGGSPNRKPAADQSQHKVPRTVFRIRTAWSWCSTRHFLGLVMRIYWVAATCNLKKPELYCIYTRYNNFPADKNLYTLANASFSRQQTASRSSGLTCSTGTPSRLHIPNRGGSKPR